MKSDDESKLFDSGGNVGCGKCVCRLFGFYSKLAAEDFVFVFWAVVSLVLVYILALDDQLTGFLSGVNKLIQESVVVFSKVNGKGVWGSDLANAHFFLMSMSIPFQLIMFFMIPSAKVAVGVRKKRSHGLLWAIAFFAVLLAGLLTLGPGASIRYMKIFGEKQIIALADFAITVIFSYLVRLITVAIFDSGGG